MERITIDTFPVEPVNFLSQSDIRLWVMCLELDKECIARGYRYPERRIKPRELRRVV